MATPEIEQIRSDYERLWETSKQRLAGGFVDSDPVPEEGSARFGVRLVPLARTALEKR